MTIGAAIATLAVILVILFGPTALSCSGSPDGFQACFNKKLASLGIVPEQPVSVAETTEPAPEAPAPDTATTPETPAATPAETPAEPAPVADGLIAATFGLLRAEPDGSVVIAGSGKPGSTIEIFANGELLGTTVTEPTGDWVFVPETRLAPGGLEITLGEAGSEELAAQSFVVVIDPELKAEPLVVASTPGEASAVLQGLVPPTATADVPAAGTGTEVAAVDPAATTPAAPIADATAPAPEAATTEAPAPAEDTPTEVATTDPAAATPAPETAVAAVPASIDAIEIDGNRNFFAGGGTDGSPVRVYVDDVFVAESVVADGRWLVESGNVLTKPSQRVRVDILKPGSAEVASRAEVNFVVELPAAAPESPIVVADATPAETPADAQSETAVVPETTPPAAAPSADSTSAQQMPAVENPQPPVEEPAAVPGESKPKDEKPAEVAAAPAPAPASEPTVQAPASQPDAPAQPAEMEVADATQAAPEAPKPAPDQVLPKPSTDAATGPDVEQPAPVAEPAPASEPAATAEAAPATETAAPAADQPAAEPASEAAPAVAPEVIAAPEPEVQVAEQSAPPAVPATEDAEVPTLVAVQVGDAESLRFASGKAIIRRGDNLWTIARRVYGSGIKYTTIFQANDNQIRNPNRIYPGQVFDLPIKAE